MKHFILTTIAAMVIAISNNVPVWANDANIPIYLGTYTRADGSKGIYLTHLNSQDGSLSEPKLVAEVPNPAFLAKHPTQPRLYSISEGGPSTSGNVHSFTIDPATSALTKLNEQSVPLSGLCHLAVFALPLWLDESQQNEKIEKYAVVVASYSDGGIASLPLTDDGKLAPYASIHKHTGSGPTQRQRQAHAHAVHPTLPLGFMVAVPDLGADKVFFYWTRPDGKLAPDSNNKLDLPPGSGPRHAAFASETRSTAFILNELNSTLTVVTPGEVAEGPNSLLIRQTLSTLPEGKSGEGNTTAEIFLHPNGRFLYASNRGDDSIALFYFDGEKRELENLRRVTGGPVTGPGVDVVASPLSESMYVHPLHESLLEFVETVPCGKHPRSFDLSPDGKWLIVAAMNDDRVTTFRIDAETGRLTATGHGISVKQPTCVLPIVME